MRERRWMTVLAAVALTVLGLAGCTKDSATTTSSTTTLPSSVVLLADGLRIDPAGTKLAFDQPIGPTQAAVTAVLGSPVGQQSNDECPAGPMASVNYAKDFSLQVQQGNLVGWFLDGRGAATLTTDTGIRLGSTRAQLDTAAPSATVTNTSIGWEFDAGGVFGTLESENGEVTNLWAGRACIFR